MMRLVEARRDGRLAANEVQSLERHLRTCRACRVLARDLERLAALGRRLELPARSALAHRRARLALMREVAAPPVRGLRWPWVMGVAAAVAATVVLWRVGDAPAHLEAAGLGGLEVPALAPIATQVMPEAHARFAREVVLDGSTRIERLTLAEGGLLIEVETLRSGQRFVVVTSDAEVEVRGTRFVVRAEHGLLREVVVHEGVVEVRTAGAQRRLTAGEAWAAPLAADEEETPEEAPPKPQRAAKPQEKAAKPEAGEPSAKPEAGVGVGASEAFADAMSALEAGNYGEAGASLRAFVADHDEDARAEDAAFLVIVAMQRAGRHAEAAAAARDYLDRFPNGARRAEASVIAQSHPKD